VVQGDDTVMRERLTYYSGSDHTYAYTALAGIAGANSYTARLRVSQADGGGSTITWHADIDAAAPRAVEIAEGTKQVFDAGIGTIAAFSDGVFAPTKPRQGRATIEARQIGSFPRLGLSVVPEGLKEAGTIALYLHGIGGNWQNWHPQLSTLGGDIPSVALDLRGYGDSTMGAGPTTIDDYFDDILAVMAEFRAKNLILVGLSYGSWIATSFALRHPNMMRGLVLCGGCTGMSEADPDERQAFRVSREVPLDAGQTPADIAASVVDIIAGPQASGDVRDLLTQSMAAIPPATYRDALNCFCNPLEKLDFAKLSCPVLLMTGDYDRLAPVADIRSVSHRFHDAGAPYVQFETIKDTGHVCNVESPSAVNQHLTGFFTMLAGPATKTLSPKVAKRAEKRRRILDAALREFSRNGFSGASMQAIAEGAGVPKPTLYQYIGQKDAIFRAVLDRGRAQILAPFENAQGRDLVPVLWEFSWSYADFVLHPDNLSIARLVIGEAERVPEIARQFHDNGPALAIRGIADYLISQREIGVLRFDNAELTSDHLWSLILSGPRNHALHFPADPLGPQQIGQHIVAGLQIFLRGYATEPETVLETLAEIAVFDRRIDSQIGDLNAKDP
jgi:pimeloyl-ACP methyl ester carboxylesterase/AcrR family transcriptional regulator